MLKKDYDMSRVYGALASPIRRQIVEVLRSRGRAGFKELHETVKTSVGALYHHLDALEGIVTQGPDKKYELTEEGRAAIEALSVTEEKIAIGNFPPRRSETRIGYLAKEFLFGRSILQYISQDSFRSIPITILIVALGGWLSYQTKLEPLLLFYINPSSGFSRASLGLLFPAGWLATSGTAEILSIVVYKRRGDELALLTSTAFAMLPLLIVPGSVVVLEALGYSFTALGFLIVLLPILLQVWMICLLSSAISFSKGLKVEKTAVVSLGVIYLNVAALLVLLEIGVF